MPLLFQTQGLRSLCQFSFLKRILPLDSSLFRSWRFLLWSCLVDFIMGKRRPFRWKTWELQLIQLGQLRNIKLAAQLDKEGRFNGSVWSSVSREKILGRGLCRCATYLKPNHQIGTGFNHLNHWKDYFEGEHLQSAYLLDLSVTTRITPFLGFQPAEADIAKHIMKTRGFGGLMIGYAGMQVPFWLWRYLIPWDIGNVGFPNFVVISWDIGIPTKKHDVVRIFQQKFIQVLDTLRNKMSPLNHQCCFGIAAKFSRCDNVCGRVASFWPWTSTRVGSGIPWEVWKLFCCFPTWNFVWKFNEHLENCRCF